MIASDSWVITDGEQCCPSPPSKTCNVNTVACSAEYFDSTLEACETLILGPNYVAADGANVSVSSGQQIDFLSGFTVESGATFNATVCGQSLCLTSPSPMPYGCHSCVDQICNLASYAYCCELEFDETCLDMVGAECGLTCGRMDLPPH